MNTKPCPQCGHPAPIFSAPGDDHKPDCPLAYSLHSNPVLIIEELEGKLKKAYDGNKKLLDQLSELKQEKQKLWESELCYRRFCEANKKCSEIWEKSCNEWKEEYLTLERKRNELWIELDRYCTVHEDIAAKFEEPIQEPTRKTRELLNRTK